MVLRDVGNSRPAAGAATGDAAAPLKTFVRRRKVRAGGSGRARTLPFVPWRT
jgi:hypothetical protein